MRKDKTIGRYRPKNRIAGKWVEKLSIGPTRLLGSFFKFYQFSGTYSLKKSEEFKRKFKAGEKIYLLGIGPSGHNSAAALVEISMDDGINVIANNEEERYTGIKNDGQFPANSLNDIINMLDERGMSTSDIFAVVASWDYIKGISTIIRLAIEEAPQSFNLIKKQASPHMNFWHFVNALKAPYLLKKFFNTPKSVPIIGMRHHNNHAFYPYAISPFSNSPDPVIIIVMDGFGDDGSISHYLAQKDSVQLIRNYPDIMDSQGLLYAIISSTQGGWEPLSSEGRYMGSSAWGNMNRLTNTYYKKLRQILYFKDDGYVFINRSLINYHKYGQINPYQNELKKILGEPIPQEQIWNPDIVLDVNNIKHAPITQERVDKAAALQMIYEDALFHMVDYLIRKTASNRLILSGGTALNCIANMKLLEHFDEDYYKKTLHRKHTRLHLWIPPNPSDTGTAAGAAFQFAMQNGAHPGKRLEHAFICGNTAPNGAILKCLNKNSEIDFIKLGNTNDNLFEIADLAAFIIAHNGIIGLYQGRGETGPRALGHRSILANPCLPDTLKQINERVKFREKIRPLAPILTLEEAKRLFQLSEGASDNNYNAYNYMVLTVKANKEAFSIIPSVIHKDGTSRIQICREDADPLSYNILKALKKHIGVEVAVNTSLNVGTPIVHSPEQAVEALSRSKGLNGLLMIECDGQAYLVWHNIQTPPKDGGKLIQKCYQQWKLTLQPET